jgi:hypothetical protein
MLHLVEMLSDPDRRGARRSLALALQKLCCSSVYPCNNKGHQYTLVLSKVSVFETRAFRIIRLETYIREVCRQNFGWDGLPRISLSILLSLSKPEKNFLVLCRI